MRLKKIIALILTAATAAGCAVFSHAAAAGSPENAWLTLSSNTSGARYFSDSYGKPINLFGMARCQSHADEENSLYGGVYELALHYKELGCNIMRLAIDASEICAEGGGTTEEKISRFISESIEPDIQAIIRAGMYVMPDVHMYPPAPPENADGAEYTVKYARDNYIPLLKALAQMYSEEPMVAAFELWNEPYPADAQTLTYDKNKWNGLVRQFYIDAVNEVRKYDTRHVLLVSDWNAGWGAALPETWSGYFDKLDPIFRNTAHSVHVSKQQLDTEWNYYETYYKTLARNNNICLFFGEIETEGELMNETGINNLTSFFSGTENEFHFPGILWRPHTDDMNYVGLWGEWAKSYAMATVRPETAAVIEAGRIYSCSAAAETVSEKYLFGKSVYGSGARLLPTGSGKYLELPFENGKMLENGNFTVRTELVGAENSADDIILAYRTANGEIRQLSHLKISLGVGERAGITVSAFSRSPIAAIVLFNTDKDKKSHIIDRVYVTSEKSSLINGNAGAVETVFTTDGTVYDSFSDAEITKSLVAFNADHWNSDSSNYSSSDVSITMGHSEQWRDAHYSALYNTGKIVLNEGEYGNYITFTTACGWDDDLTLRYGPDSDYSADTSGTEYVYMTVRLTKENLNLFKNARVFSKKTIGNSAESRDVKTALVLPLGENSGVTFDTWLNALGNVVPDKWVTLKLSVTNGEAACPAAEMKHFCFKFGEQLAAEMSLKSVVLTAEKPNVVKTAGAKISVSGKTSLKFISVLFPAVLPQGAVITAYGTEIFADSSESVFIPAEEVSVCGDGGFEYSATVKNIGNAFYDKFFYARAYVRYTVNGEEETAYGNTCARSVCTAAGEAVASGNEDSGNLPFLKELCRAYKNGALLANEVSPYRLTGNAWNPQLTIGIFEKSVPQDRNTLTLSIACAEIDKLLSNYSPGSKMSVGNGTFTYNSEKDLGIYFGGVDVAGVGVTQKDLITALTKNRAVLKNGGSVTLRLPISGSFGAHPVINKLCIMTAHGSSAANTDGITLGISGLSIGK